MKRILIIRLSAIGDVIMATSMVEAVRSKFPDAYVAWLVQPECRDLLSDHPALDAVITWPRKEWQGLWRNRDWKALAGAVHSFRRALRANQFDIAYDLQGLLKSGLMAWLSGAPERVGLGSREGSRWLMTRIVDRQGGEAQYIGSEYHHLARLEGLTTDRCPMSIHVSENVRGNAELLLREIGIKDGYGVICPFTTRAQKHWSEHAWLELVPILRTTWEGELVLLGGPGDLAAAQRISSGTRVKSLVGKTRLQEAAAIIRNARYLIGVDTGLTHLGTAFAIPTVALFGSTCPYRKTDSERTRVIYHELNCSPCRRRPTCDGAYTCMQGISPREVVDTLQQVLPPG